MERGERGETKERDEGYDGVEAAAATLRRQRRHGTEESSSAPAGLNPFAFGAMGASEDADRKLGTGAEASRVARAEGARSSVELSRTDSTPLCQCKKTEMRSHGPLPGSSPF